MTVPKQAEHRMSTAVLCDVVRREQGKERDRAGGRARGTEEAEREREGESSSALWPTARTRRSAACSNGESDRRARLDPTDVGCIKEGTRAVNQLACHLFLASPHAPFATLGLGGRFIASSHTTHTLFLHSSTARAGYSDHAPWLDSSILSK